MHCLIIGYGSIGKRHAQVLQKLGCRVSLVTSQNISDFIYYKTIEDALEKEVFEYVVISNSTHLHYDTLIKLIQYDYRGIVLVEKPLFSQVEQLPENKIKKLLVAYNLRFCELINRVKNIIADESVVTFSAYVGQYLPTWRRGTDYRNSYSANKAFGGGVLRDLSHELDYSIWLCGPCLAVTATGGQLSKLEISSDDTYSIIMKCASCHHVNIHLNYLDRTIRRTVVINTQQHTITLDLVKGHLTIDGELKVQSPDRTLTYTHQHQAVLNHQFDSFCQYDEGLYLMNLIQTIEYASSLQTWVTL